MRGAGCGCGSDSGARAVGIRGWFDRCLDPYLRVRLRILISRAPVWPEKKRQRHQRALLIERRGLSLDELEKSLATMQERGAEAVLGRPQPRPAIGPTPSLGNLEHE